MDRERFLKNSAVHEIAGCILYGFGVAGITAVGLGLVEKERIENDLENLASDFARVEEIKSELLKEQSVIPHAPDKIELVETDRKIFTIERGAANFTLQQENTLIRNAELNKRYDLISKIQGLG